MFSHLKYIVPAILLVFWGSKYVILNSTRGLRNNNAGNIRGASYEWDGELARDDKGFVIFNSHEYGIRAIGKIIATYRKKYYLYTVEEIITRWAPPNENDTAAYIRSIEQTSGIKRSDTVSDENVVAFIAALIKHENSINPFSDAFIVRSLQIA